MDLERRPRLMIPEIVDEEEKLLDEKKVHQSCILEKVGKPNIGNRR